ncbi:BZ3500_MvSof-1268-A1-R1_Chr1-1g01197 [Microbotryum saponariae]|uniref:BZ3500_MvSof-1268-A1-R1_Chr1-1g01197 protein n=1 Tax=Microbotryum saponariae TaxID=289078 RepID=A0A2X0LCL1_9BASI|nr:BZ3500_MvSof-1268-A1-R1_Chr1-1g01197 [Microbotryum saponariae]SCZ93633.1 BZ3501_MvSof-1269-A2-R1_Chr1-1g00793 [Microbotryum saponariae]
MICFSLHVLALSMVASVLTSMATATTNTTLSFPLSRIPGEFQDFDQKCRTWADEGTFVSRGPDPLGIQNCEVLAFNATLGTPHSESPIKDRLGIEAAKYVYESRCFCEPATQEPIIWFKRYQKCALYGPPQNGIFPKKPLPQNDPRPNTLLKARCGQCTRDITDPLRYNLHNPGL